MCLPTRCTTALACSRACGPTLRLVGRRSFRLVEHTERLFDSAAILQIEMPYSKQQMLDAQCEVFAANELSEGYIAASGLSRQREHGLRAVDLRTHAAIACWPWPDYMDPESRETRHHGAHVVLYAPSRQHHDVQAKASGNYINSILALREAQDAGCDEALLLDSEGYVAEGSGENIFVVKKGVIHTPEPTSCLPGITRDTILVFAREQGLDVVERRITRDEIYIADEAFFTGTAAEVLPVRELDGRVIGSGKRGPITERLQALYFDQVRGRREAHPEWHTPALS